jgi:hypothetical protein
VVILDKRREGAEKMREKKSLTIRQLGHDLHGIRVDVGTVIRKKDEISDQHWMTDRAHDQVR